ncbi:MAG: hypothetical protein LBP76_13065 [Treponema sp.]|jgi:hypothetical protein|nr:hypothetical protein [Treponema sp.]
MEGLFDNPFIIIAFIVFIVTRIFNALHENSKNKRPAQPPHDVPEETAETFEDTDDWKAAGPDLRREAVEAIEAVVRKNEGEGKRTVQEEDYVPFPQGIGHSAADNSAVKGGPLPLGHSVLTDIEETEKGRWGALDRQKAENIQPNSAGAAPYPEPASGFTGISGQVSYLKKAVVWAEILGPPRALQDL